jgi:hypothetical protein
MAQSTTKQLRRDLAEIRKHVEECRRDLGIGNGEPVRPSVKRGGFFGALRAPRQARRQAPFA